MNPAFLLIQVDPMGYVRQTKADRWKKRPVVLRYHAYRDSLREAVRFYLPESTNSAKMLFTIAMPASWSKKKRAAMNGQLHQQKPDVDNLEKAVLDALFTEDKRLAHCEALKVWGEVGSVEARFTTRKDNWFDWFDLYG